MEYANTSAVHLGDLKKGKRKEDRLQDKIPNVKVLLWFIAPGVTWIKLRKAKRATSKNLLVLSESRNDLKVSEQILLTSTSESPPYLFLSIEICFRNRDFNHNTLQGVRFCCVLSCVKVPHVLLTTDVKLMIRSGESKSVGEWGRKHGNESGSDSFNQFYRRENGSC